MKVSVRFATPDDAKVLHELIVALATYEQNPDAVEVTPEVLRAQLASAPPPFECFVAEKDGRDVVGFALFFSTYSTWRGLSGIWLEDIFVPEEYRGQGIGGALYSRVLEIARERKCGRLDLAVLKWNEPTIRMYKKLGMKELDEWAMYRLEL